MLIICMAFLMIFMVTVRWIILTQRKLLTLDENVGNAMSQIGTQLSGCFDAIMTLLELIKDYDWYEGESLADLVKSRRGLITAKSTPEEASRQERAISDVLERLATVTERYPELRANQKYIKTVEAVESFKKVMQTSRLLYNHSITKLSYEIRMFPTSVIAGVMKVKRIKWI